MMIFDANSLSRHALHIRIELVSSWTVFFSWMATHSIKEVRRRGAPNYSVAVKTDSRNDYYRSVVRDL